MLLTMKIPLNDKSMDLFYAAIKNTCDIYSL